MTDEIAYEPITVYADEKIKVSYCLYSLSSFSRRERHAKTLEIAQEEVLVCVGLCLYERVHRIQLRLREEQTTCQLLALVAINALSTNFQVITASEIL